MRVRRAEKKARDRPMNGSTGKDGNMKSGKLCTNIGFIKNVKIKPDIISLNTKDFKFEKLFMVKKLITFGART